MDERLKKQLQFVLELDKIKNIKRQTYLADGNRKENDAEHSWHLAIMAAVLSEYSNEPVDVLKTIIMVLIHDVVEIDAGDTYAYDERGNESKNEREKAAADRIFNILPEDQADYFRCLWEEFETCETSEARFARTLDNIQPAMLNDASGGKSWREHEVRMTQPMKRNEKTPKGSKTLWEYALSLFEHNVELGNIIDDRN